MPAKREDVRKVLESGCTVLLNPWDIRTTRMFQHLMAFRLQR